MCDVGKAGKEAPEQELREDYLFSGTQPAAQLVPGFPDLQMANSLQRK